MRSPYQPYQKELQGVNALADKFQRTSSYELINRVLANPKSIIESFAILRELAHRELGMRPFDVQIRAAFALYHGSLTQMNTGEGKTLAAVLPAALKSLQGHKVHIMTFNDYLAGRDANWMKPLYDCLGLGVGVVYDQLDQDTKRSVYHSDIVYGTAKQFGFDYLRSFIAYDPSEILIPQFDFAIIDEADALLIDEARNPLVLAGNLGGTGLDLQRITDFVSQLSAASDYALDEYARNVYLTEQGIDKVEKEFAVQNLFEEANRYLHSALNLSLHAHTLLERDRDYIVKNDEIQQVDEFTGRVVKDRKWQHGLQMAVESNEGVEVQPEGKLLGSTILPACLKQYKSFAAMTATASQAEDEFRKMYGLEIVILPPNQKLMRIDLPDQIFSHHEAKLQALIREVKKIHQTRRPILIGTLTVKESEHLAAQLSQVGLETQVLNASNDEEEAKIIAEAGALGTITISTNMAGRGTDILLGGQSGENRDAVIALGGLHVIGTNRHESRRIDDQLRGRAGRQGDPGSSQFFISFDDELMVKYNLKKILPKKYRALRQDAPLSIPVVEKRIAQAQRIIEGQMQELRKTLFEYSLIVDQQRAIWQRWRQSFLFDQDELSADISAQQKDIILNQFDKQWAAFLDHAEELKEGIYLLRLGGENPLRKFNKKMDYRFRYAYDEMDRIVQMIVTASDPGEYDLQIEKPSSTWNYVVNDSPFQNQFIINLLASSLLGTAR